MRDLIIIKYGEIALKGNNRSFFEGKLVGNMKRMLKNVAPVTVEKTHGRMYLHFDRNDYDKIADRVKDIYGIVKFSPGVKVINEIPKMQEEALAVAKDLNERKPFKTFKVETRRPNKGFQMKSPEISRQVGGYILSQMEGIRVDVHNPDVIIYLEVREQTYIYCDEVEGLGGMPYGTAGRGMLLLSGGIDSPVAGWMMAKRGVNIDAVHYHSYPFTSERALEKVLDLAKRLSYFTGNLRVHSVNLLEIQQAIGAKCPEEEMTILSRRFMMRIAENIAVKRKCQSLITGESIAQVASQTMEGLTVTTDAVNMPILRPLIAMDKVDIIKVAERIDTFETSILPFEDCCTVFLPKRVVTKPRVDQMEKSEAALDVQDLVNRAADSCEIYTFVDGEMLEAKE